jgi:hypothetical protein
MLAVLDENINKNTKMLMKIEKRLENEVHTKTN